MGGGRGRDVRMAADSTMLRMVNLLIALSLGVHREQLLQRMGLTWPRPFLLRPLFFLFLTILAVGCPVGGGFQISDRDREKAAQSSRSDNEVILGEWSTYWVDFLLVSEGGLLWWVVVVEVESSNSGVGIL